MIELTREQWECYLHTPQTVVNYVNKSCSDILKNARSPEGALRNILMMLNRFQEYGFRDTECEWVAVETINKFFSDKEDVDRWSVGFV